MVVLFSMLERIVFAPVRGLWRVPLLFWMAWLIALVFVIGAWLVLYQPAVGINFTLSEGVFLGAGLAIVAAYFGHGLNRDSIKPLLGWWINPFITLATLVLAIIAVELGLRYWVVMSDNFALSKMHQNWNRLYWQPVNELGFRDYPPNTDPTRQKIIVMGDSFVAGYGVNDIDDTFPHQLGALMGEDYAVNIVAVPGIGIGTALADVMKYPVKPDVLVVSHYINDLIEGAAKRVLPAFEGVRQTPPEGLSWWIDNFYIANFWYYRVYHYFSINAGTRYSDYIREAYANTEAWRIYETEELDVLIAWTEANDVQLYVIVWHNLADREGSLPLIAPVLAYFEEKGIPTLNMAEALEGLPVSQITANIFDAHPSIEAHRIASERLYALIIP